MSFDCKNNSIRFIIWLCCLQMAHGQNGTDQSSRILSRQRRYLIFPSGSSIQFVSDIDIYWPGWVPPYPITGISVALAWALPDKPTYPEDDLIDLYENDHLHRRKDTNVTENIASEQSNTTTAPTKATSRIHLQTIMKLIRLFLPAANSAASAADSIDANDIEAILDYINAFDHSIRRQDSSKYWNASVAAINYANRFNQSDRHQFSRGNATVAHKQHPPMLSLQSDVPTKYTDRHADNAFKKYLANTYFRPWIESSLFTKSGTANAEQSRNPSNESPPLKSKSSKLHTIYPAIEKRNKRSASMTWQERFFLDHHRSTRHELYEIIEKYLSAKGYNGTACVLKTLCEVGKKQSDSEPSTFLAEIVRVVFSLPAAQTKSVIDKRQVEYDEAHRSADDCSKLFHQCPRSVWEAAFMIEFHE